MIQLLAWFVHCRLPKKSLYLLCELKHEVQSIKRSRIELVATQPSSLDQADTLDDFRDLEEKLKLPEE